jgi:hypothetical protein
MEPALLCVCWIAPQSDHVLKFSIQVLGTMLCEKRFGYLQEVVLWRIFGISKLFQTQKIILMLV